MHRRTQDGRFDALRLASSRADISGRLDPATLSRLEDWVAGPGGHVDWTIRGSTDPEGRAALRLEIDGEVPMTCQRCLGVVTELVTQSTLLLLARDDEELVRLDEASEHEVVSVREPLDPVTLVEDELLLSLPFAPRHESDCASPAEVATK